MNCAETRPYLQAFVDQELSPERAIDVRRHLGECTECAAEVELTHSVCRATRVSVMGITMCPKFQARLAQGLAVERRRQQALMIGPPLSWRAIVPLAAAASVALFFGVRTNTSAGAAAGGSSFTAGSPVMGDIYSSSNPMEFLVQHHAETQEPEMRDQSAVDLMEPRLGFPVHVPNLERFGARFEGANLVLMNNTRMAMLRYRLAGRKVTLYVYNPEEMPLRAQRALRPEVVGSRAVFVGQRRGYSIASCEDRGVGYAVTTDLSDRESAELVAAVSH